MAEKIASVEELLARLADIRSRSLGGEERTQETLEIMADALIALLAEVRTREERAVVTSLG
jgi:hypothetical protein